MESYYFVLDRLLQLLSSLHPAFILSSWCPCFLRRCQWLQTKPQPGRGRADKSLTISDDPAHWLWSIFIGLCFILLSSFSDTKNFVAHIPYHFGLHSKQLGYSILGLFNQCTCMVNANDVISSKLSQFIPSAYLPVRYNMLLPKPLRYAFFSAVSCRVSVMFSLAAAYERRRHFGLPKAMPGTRATWYLRCQESPVTSRMLRVGTSTKVLWNVGENMWKSNSIHSIQMSSILNSSYTFVEALFGKDSWSKSFCNILICYQRHFCSK